MLLNVGGVPHFLLGFLSCRYVVFTVWHHTPESQFVGTKMDNNACIQNLVNFVLLQGTGIPLLEHFPFWQMHAHLGGVRLMPEVLHYIECTNIRARVAVLTLYADKLFWFR